MLMKSDNRIDNVMKRCLIISILVISIVFVTVILCISFNKNDNFIGEMVEFGSYYKYKIENKQPLCWEVADTDKDYVYLITHDIIDCVPFYTERPDEYSKLWTNSYIRDWLNNDFYSIAFNEYEKDMVEAVDLKVGDNWSYEGKNEAEYTTDKVFLMTARQAKSLDDRILCSNCTEFSKERGVFYLPDSGYGMWWLMSPGYYCTTGVYIDIYGNMHNGNSFTVDRNTDIGLTCNYCGVRPMIAVSYKTFDEITHKTN